MYYIASQGLNTYAKNLSRKYGGTFQRCSAFSSRAEGAKNPGNEWPLLPMQKNKNGSRKRETLPNMQRTTGARAQGKTGTKIGVVKTEKLQAMKETGKNGGKVRQPPKTAWLGDAEPLIALSKAKPKTAKVRFCENSACQSRLSIHNKSRFCYRCQEAARNKKTPTNFFEYAGRGQRSDDQRQYELRVGQS